MREGQEVGKGGRTIERWEGRGKKKEKWSNEKGGRENDSENEEEEEGGRPGRKKGKK